MMNSHFISWDEQRDLAHPGNTPETITFCVEHFINCVKETLKTHQYFSVALSGGSTPKAIFTQLFSPPASKEINWKRILVLWVDERNVPPTHPDSNFRMAMDAGMNTLPIPSSHIFRMKAEENIEKNAREYNVRLHEILGPFPCDLVMLGLGNDGHTASLFPRTKALKETDAWVVANEVPQKNTCRMTLTYPFINQAKNIVIYVLGKHKSTIIEKVFLKKQLSALPIDQIGTPQNKALWVVDSAAGEKLFRKQVGKQH